MSKSARALRIPPIRSVQDFVTADGWTIPAMNPNEFAAIQKKVMDNMIYYQTNYGAVAIGLLVLVAFFRPTAIIFGLLVVAALLAGFVYSSRQKAAFTATLQDRPVAILLLLLVASFMIVRMFGTVFAFLVGIVLPLALIVAHAAVRNSSLQNKAENAAEKLSSEVTPMGLLLGWLGAKAAASEEQSKPSPKRK